MSSNTKQFSKQDRQYLNYLTLLTVITKALQRKQGKQQIDFNFADELAWEVSQQISSDVLIERAKTLTVDEILESRIVKDAALSQSHGIPYAKKKPAPEGHNGANWGILMGVILLMLLLIFATANAV
jgi:uncharacterized integral membrane protein